MIETIAYAIVCFIICKNCSARDRLIKAGRGAILFIALFFAYNTLQPLLPEEIDYLLYSTIWGVLFAYAVPNGTKKTKGIDKGTEGDNEKDSKEKKPQEGQTPPNSTLN